MKFKKKKPFFRKLKNHNSPISAKLRPLTADPSEAAVAVSDELIKTLPGKT